MRYLDRNLLSKILARINYYLLSKSKRVLLNFSGHQGDINYVNSQMEFSKSRFNKFRGEYPILNGLESTSKATLRSIIDIIPKNVCSIYNSTSGSTGIPFKFLVPVNHFGREWIASRYIWSTHLDDFSLNEPIITIRTYTPKDNEDIFRVDKFQHFYYISPYHLNEDTLDSVIDYMDKSKSRVLRGYPSSIYLLSLLLEAKDIKIPGIKLITLSSEVLEENYIDKIVSAFPNASICNQYGQNEGVVALFTCRNGNWHNADFYGKFELSEENTIVGTSFNNHVFPFYRYDTGDLVERIEPILCSCGLGRTVGIKTIQGRRDDWLYKSDRTKVPSINFTSAFKSIEGIEQYQLIQSEKTLQIQFNVVLKKQVRNTEEISEQIMKNIHMRLGDVQIQINFVQEIERNQKTNKIKTIIRNE